MKKIIFLILLVANGISLFAQQEIGLHFMSDVYNQNLTNPAFQMDKKITISLPSIYENLRFTGPTYGDFQSTYDENLVSVTAAIDKMEERNDLRNVLALQTLGIGAKFGNIQLNLSHQIRSDVFVDYPKALAQFAWQGNAKFIGETLEMNNQADITAYNEFALGASMKISILQIGVRGKYLSGLGNVSTNSDRDNLSVYTDTDVYQLTLNTDYQFRSSRFIEYNGLDSITNDINLLGLSDGGFITDNTGFAIDLGATVDLGKIGIAVSVLDIGSINWKEEAKTYTSQGSHIYEGVDLDNILTSDDISFSEALDTISEIFQFETVEESYKTQLPTRLYTSVTYDMTEKLTVGAMYFLELYQGNQLSAIGLSGRYKLAKKVGLGMTYAAIADKGFNLGLNADVKLGPVQLFATTDNFLNLLSIDNAQLFTFRAGANLSF